MQALILHDQLDEVERLGRSLSRRGFMVRSFADQSSAITFACETPTDLVVLKQVIAGRHTTSVALAAEYKNPHCASILLSEFSREDTVELFELLPSMRAILGPTPNANTLSALALDAVGSPSQQMLILGSKARVAGAKSLAIA